MVVRFTEGNHEWMSIGDRLINAELLGSHWITCVDSGFQTTQLVDEVSDQYRPLRLLSGARPYLAIIC